MSQAASPFPHLSSQVRFKTQTRRSLRVRVFRVFEFGCRQNPDNKVAEDMFMKIAKAYEALTDPTVRDAGGGNLPASACPT